MENASKALLMAASVLIAIIVIGAFVLMMSNLTDYQDKSYQATADAQTTEFNNQFITYDRDEVRGSDMISLMNRVLDYNIRNVPSGYTQMEIELTISTSIREDLTYDETNRLITRTDGKYNQSNISEIVGTPSSANGNISNDKIRSIENKYEQKYANQLASEISNIATIVEDRTLNTETKKNEAFDKERMLPKHADSYGGVTQIYEDALIYYEYVQFKRTYFACTNTEYDKDTGRIIKMVFKCTGIGV